MGTNDLKYEHEIQHEHKIVHEQHLDDNGLGAEYINQE